MGSFDNDKTLGRGEILSNVVDVNEEFLVWEKIAVFEDMIIPGHDDYGPTTKTVLRVSRMNAPEEMIEVSCIGASGQKMAKLDSDEVPCICKLITFTSQTYGRDGTIIQWVRDLDADQAKALSESL